MNIASDFIAKSISIQTSDQSATEQHSGMASPPTTTVTCTNFDELLAAKKSTRRIELIFNDAFYHNNPVQLGSSLTFWKCKEALFYNTENLIAFAFQENCVHTIGDCLFRKCSNLQRCKLPNRLNKLGWGVFAGGQQASNIIGAFEERSEEQYYRNLLIIRL